MGIEIEAKFRVDEAMRGRVRARLEELGARRMGDVLETNIFFDTKDGALRRADKGLRLRRNHDVQSGRDLFVLTYKGPKTAAKFKTREEIEVEVGTGDLGEVLARLGYGEMLSFEKRRESWKLNECTVELDELPRLGFFVEIEGPGE